MRFIFTVFAFIFSLGTLIMGANVPDVPGLQIEVLKEAEGDPREVKKGDEIAVHYYGTLLDSGKKFDASYDRNQPLEFTAGTGMVIKGWDQGLIGMKVGEKRKLTIPPELAYGDSGVGPIPPKATLVFETELVSIQGKDEL